MGAATCLHGRLGHMNGMCRQYLRQLPRVCTKRRAQLPQASVNGKTTSPDVSAVTGKATTPEAHAEPAASTSYVPEKAKSSSSSSRRSSRPVTPVSTPALGVSGPYITTASMDGDAFLGTELIKRELVEPYRLSKQQMEIIHELQESMVNCSTAFIFVSIMGIALSIAASQGLEVEDAPEVLINGITVGDIASWVDSLLFAGLLRYGATAFAAVEDSTEDKQMAYTFVGLSRLGLIGQQLAIAAGAVSIATTLEAAAKWPPLVTFASGVFFFVAVVRSSAMWFVLSKYGTKIDDVDEALEAEKRCYVAANEEEELPLLDRIAIRVAFTQLLQFNSAGRRASEPAVFAAAAAAVESSKEQDQLTERGAVAIAAAAGGVVVSKEVSFDSNNPFGAAAAQAALARAAMKGRLAARDATVKGLDLLKSIPLPVIQRSQDGEEGRGPKVEPEVTAEAAAAAAAALAAAAAVEGSTSSYELTQQEERLVQATNGSWNSAALALVLQAVATGFLLAADMATDHLSPAVGDGIQVLNKAIAAELIFVATTNFDKALYSEGCDVEHLLQGLGKKGITKLFHNLSILAWAVVIAKGVSLLAPWEEASPLLKYISENFSHRAADAVLEGQEVIIQLMQ